MAQAKGKAKAVKPVKETPLMAQYNRVKAQHPDALLLFRVGDFYETFGSDAVTAAKVLNIVLTARKNGAAAEIELAGFPHHALENYLPKLVRAGHRVAVCDQLEDPKTTKTIVKRGVTEMVTPGVALNDQVLEARENNWLAAVHVVMEGRGANKRERAGVAFLDVSTGEFLAGEGTPEDIAPLLRTFRPKETLHLRHGEPTSLQLSGYRFPLDDWVWQLDFARETLEGHFGTKGLKGFGLDGQPLAVIAAGAAMHYVGTTKHDRMAHIASLGRVEWGQNVAMDGFTIRNLELLVPTHPEGTALVDVVDRSATPMGARMLRRWIAQPLCDAEGAISRRHEAVASAFLAQPCNAGRPHRRTRSRIGDLERLLAKTAAAVRISPAELDKRLRQGPSPPWRPCASWSTVRMTLSSAAGPAGWIPADAALEPNCARDLTEDPPGVLGKGALLSLRVWWTNWTQLRDLRDNGKAKLDGIRHPRGRSHRHHLPQNRLQQRLWLLPRGPPCPQRQGALRTWIRKQTLTQAERYITPELKELEQPHPRRGRAPRRRGARSLYAILVTGLAPLSCPVLQATARAVAGLDLLLGFATLAEDHGYTRPTLVDGSTLEIVGGRHPVIEHCLPDGESYVANDVALDRDHQQILMITGPNMSGKSALLRQTALIVLMAQMGCYVPARSVRMGVVDKVFTRVGASDNLSAGESTFMVEMNETASILHNLSDRSLVLLDEIGRGTSTYDGISIAWAIAEFLHEHPKSRAKTLFATHYHELNRMAERFPRIHNANVSVRQQDGKVVFLRKLIPGGSEHSFGIHVAKLAGMPAALVRRAEEVLTGLESQGAGRKEWVQDLWKLNRQRRAADELLSVG